MARKERPLTADELEAVIDVIAAEGEVAGVVALWSVLLGYPLANHTGPPFDPTGVAIPTDQWKAICQAAFDNPQHDGLRGGTLMNSGPSSYERP